jgi:hypothetical protein
VRSDGAARKRLVLLQACDGMGHQGQGVKAQAQARVMLCAGGPRRARSLEWHDSEAE